MAAPLCIEIRLRRLGDAPYISVARETCPECEQAIHIHNFSPTDGTARCDCCVEGPEDCAAENMQDDVRELLVAAIALIDARNGAPSE